MCRLPWLYRWFWDVDFGPGPVSIGQRQRLSIQYVIVPECELLLILGIRESVVALLIIVWRSTSSLNCSKERNQPYLRSLIPVTNPSVSAVDIHSLSDLPALMAAGLVLASTIPRNTFSMARMVRILRWRMVSIYNCTTRQRRMFPRIYLYQDFLS